MNTKASGEISSSEEASSEQIHGTATPYEDKRYVVAVAGHTHPLRFFEGPACCGKITDGVAFEFGNQGGWVIDLAELKKLVRMAEEKRAAIARAT